MENKELSREELLKHVKALYEYNKISDKLKNELEIDFPEIQKNKDEWIRQEIIDYLSTVDNKELIHYESWIAWLEKQNEKDEEILILKDQIESLHAAIKAIKEINRIKLEKQGEQKATNNQFTPEQADVLDKHIDKFIEQKPAEWSEEDEDNIFNIVGALDVLIQREIEKEYNGDRNANPKYYRDLQDWLKSIKDRVLPKIEWDEEDEQFLLVCKNALAKYQKTDNWDADIISRWLENRLNSPKYQKYVDYNPYKTTVESITEMCKHYDVASHSGLRDFYDNVKVKCKEAIEYDKEHSQKLWKPSDEQMEALDSFIYAKYPNIEKYGAAVKSLYQDLKKLREE